VRIAVFGLGYVGCTSAACLASRGHSVVGVDANPAKVRMIADGRSPVLEPGLPELVAEGVAAERLRAIGDPREAVATTEMSLVCVGTPAASNGSLDTQALERVAWEIGSYLPESEERHTVVVRSTVLPGTCEELLVPILSEASGLVAGEGFGVAVNPEFLREGTSIADFNDPPKIVIGEYDTASGDAVAALHADFACPLFRVPLRVAEMVKYVDNAYHALKIGFANEVGAASRAFGVDSHEVMKVFCADTKLNISTAYLKPGFAFGGSCLPKDMSALLYATRRADLDLPILEHVLESNERHLQRTVEMLLALGRRRVGLFGLAFKPGTDDLRESPLVELAERLLGKGFKLKIYDPAVSLSHLVGSNREYIESRIPHLSALLTQSPREVLEHAEVCVIGACTPETIEVMARANGRRVVDLVRLPDADERRGRDGYIGVAW
jgi:GDP-mannose 6-dehydrogenase